MFLCQLSYHLGPLQVCKCRVVIPRENYCDMWALGTAALADVLLAAYGWQNRPRSSLSDSRSNFSLTRNFTGIPGKDDYRHLQIHLSFRYYHKRFCCWACSAVSVLWRYGIWRQVRNEDCSGTSVIFLTVLSFNFFYTCLSLEQFALYVV